MELWEFTKEAATLASAAAARPTAKRLAGELRDGGKSGSAKQETEDLRSISSTVASLFGKSKAEWPASEEQNEPTATPKDHTVPGLAGAEIAHLKLGASAFTEGRLDEAIREFQAVLRINPNDAYERTDIYLFEGMIDEAMRAVDARTYVGHDEIAKIASTAWQSHPDWVIRKCRNQAESIMDEGRSKYYGSAVGWLQITRALMAPRAARMNGRPTARA